MREYHIRPMIQEDLDQVMEIWLSSNLQAHDFVSQDYWTGQKEAVREMLPKAQVYVCEYEDGCRGKIAGFAGMQEDYLAGIFVAADVRSHGIGSALLDFCRQKRKEIALNVYVRNEAAIRFYERNGFRIEETDLDPMTGQVEYTMKWHAENVTDS